MSISVVMPVRNGAEHIQHSLIPLVLLLEAGSVQELIVVNDASTDNSMAVAASLGAKVLNLETKHGPGGARNYAAEIAHGDILWFVDADVVVTADAVKHLRHALQHSSSDVAAVFGSYTNHTPASNFLSQYKNLVHHYTHQSAPRDAMTFWSGCGAIYKNQFLKIGGFNVEKYKQPSIEDIELGYRLIESGKKIVLEPLMQATHLKHWTLKQFFTTEIRQRAIPWSRLLLSRDKQYQTLNTRNIEQLRAVIACLAALFILLGLSDLAPMVLVLTVLLLSYLLNRHLFIFFLQKKGILFAVRAITFHHIFYIYATCSYAFAKAEAIWIGLTKTSARAEP